MFVLDFVTAVSAAEEEEGERRRGERGRRTVEALGERQSDPLATLIRQAAAAAPEISRVPDASRAFLAFLV